MTIDNSMSYILGMNQLLDNAEQGQLESSSSSSQTNQLLAGLNTLPSAGGEPSPDENVASIANQLAMWTNANFNFDGPTGHALLGDDEKDADPEKDDGSGRRDDDAQRTQRNFAASSAHSNAARDKNREAGMEPGFPRDIGAQAPLHDLAPDHANQHAHVNDADAPSGSSSVPESYGAGLNNAVSQAQGQQWDLTSTLALNYLLSRNPSALGGPGNASGAATNVQNSAAPSQMTGWQNASAAPYNLFAPPGTSGAPSSVGDGYAPQPASAVADADTPRGTVPKRRVSALNESEWGAAPGDPRTSLAPADAAGSTAAAQDQSGAISDDKSSLPSDRIKLVDTGNPEKDAETNRLAIDEDKRRRNTAASARFRVKKKQREAALESTARELETQVNALKQENERLRTENDWLKRLVTARPDNFQGNYFNGSASSSPYPSVPQQHRSPSSSMLGGLRPNDEQRLR